ncbi:MAG: ribonucleoside-diphosphate reductase subunit alpha [Rickettsiaceae bacterium]
MKLAKPVKFVVKKDKNRDKLLTNFGKAILRDRYLIDNEDFQDLFRRVAGYYANDEQHAQRLYEYISKLWFMPATPILSNGGTDRGMPISCFLNEIPDSLEGIVNGWTENVWLACRGGGIGSYWGNVRSINEPVKGNGKTSGVIPFLNVQDSLTLAISQGSLRRGSSAVYLPIDHPEIEEFIELRRPTGGDINRRALNIHHGVVITDAFMKAVENGDTWDLISPYDKSVINTISARDLWIRLLIARVETGEPYILFIDTVNKSIPKHHKELSLKVKTSNLCSEITLPTGLDHKQQERTAVCCLSSLNIEYFDQWKDNPEFIKDVMYFLDNVLSDFIENAPDTMSRAKYSAMRERSVGLGVMGFHSFLQMHNVPIESVMAKVWNDKIFTHIKQEADKASLSIGKERGPCMDAQDVGSNERFSNKIAIAPTASISVIAGESSPGIEPLAANSFLQKTLTGSFNVRNKYLAKLLESKGFNNDQVWSSISTHEGSVQHLSFLSDHEKDVFKTAYEINQNWLVELAAGRSDKICQGQSFNIFLLGNVNKQYLHDLHFKSWKKGVKSLYYLRTKIIQEAEKVSHTIETNEFGNLSPRNNDDQTDRYEECLSCQ